MTEKQHGRRRSRAEDHSASTAQLIPHLMARLGLSDRMWEEALLEEWPTLAGQQVSRHARPGRLERQTLHVYVTNSAWLAELHQNGQKQLLENLQARFGPDKIRRLTLRLDPDLGQHGY